MRHYWLRLILSGALGLSWIPACAGMTASGEAARSAADAAHRAIADRAEVIAEMPRGYAEHPAAQALILEMAAEEGFEREALERLFAGASRQDSILEAIARPAEKTKPWHEYRKIFITPARIEGGLEFSRRYAAALQRAEAQFGVPAALVAAIIGVETNYGGNMGRYRVLDALATLAFDYPPRSKFFTGELKHFLLMTREQQLPAAELRGSYAGAMGYGQFIPSSYRHYAVDFDGDGTADILANPVDAIGSVANYLAEHGWREGEAVAAPAIAAEGYRQEWVNAGLKPRRRAAQFAAAGIRAKGPYDPKALATAMEFEGKDGPEFWLGWRNFYIITRYNHSAMYAMAVHHLSEAIGEHLPD